MILQRNKNSMKEIGDFLQSKGGEIGVTTKRKRRCGWLDIPMLLYSSMLNGYTKLCITKLDILDSLPEIKLAIGYKLNGTPISYVPSNATELSKVEVIYETLPGWQSSTEQVRDYNDLPPNAKRYIERIEEFIQVPVKWIGVGKGRDSIITIK